MLIKKLKPEDDPEKWIKFVEDRAYNDASYDISWDKIEKLGWKSHTSLNEGLDRVINWYKNICIKDHWPLYIFNE